MDLTPRRSNRRLPFEPPALSLQRTAEVFTQRLETERRTAFSLDDRIRAAEVRLAEKQLGMKTANSLKAGNCKEEELLEALEWRLNRAKLDLGELIVQNRRLREEIDSVRRGNVENLNTSRRVGEELSGLKETTEAARQRTCRSVASSTTAHSKLLRLQEAREAGLLDLSLSSLRSRVLEDRRLNREQLSALLSTAPCSETSETAQVTSFLRSKWLTRVQSKRKEVESYLHHIQTLTLGFHNMQTFSNIDQIPHIVTAFLNAVERQQEIQQHLVTVSEQMDELRGEQIGIRRTLQAETQGETAEMRDWRERKEALWVEMAGMRAKMRKIAVKSGNLERELEVLQGPLREIDQIGRKLGLKAVIFTPPDTTKPLDSVLFPEIEQIMERLVAIVHKNDLSAVHFQDFSLLQAKQFSTFPLLSELPQAEGSFEPSEEPLTAQSFRLRAQKVLKSAL